MTLASGSRLGPYEIVSPLGAGGMGEVYKARDTRLGRTVAVKVLPSHLSEDSERRQRFEREARTISSLSHPHICALYDVGHQDGTDYLVMEYIEGETLASRLAKGALPLEQALSCSIEIADALDKAHRQGIVHRDLKPGNIMLTKSGVKLLDFGLAKLRAVESGPVFSRLSALPTEGRPLTEEGTILGTLQYMAPEQLEGKEADARTDIFASGAVLYEMATGQRAFSGKSQASLIAAILSSEAHPISSLQPMAPPALDRVVKRCLTKDPDDRWQTARDLALELQWIAEGGPQAGLPAPVARRKGRERLAWTVTAAAVLVASVAGIVGWRMWRSTSSVPRPVTRFVLGLTPPHAVSLWQRHSFALSPDGTRLAYTARQNGRTQLYLRAMETLEAAPLPGTEDGSGPFFSPDGQWLGFFTASKLKKISLAGGAPITLCDVPPVTRGASWAPDDTIVLTWTNSSGLWRISAAGGTPNPLTTLDTKKGEKTHRWPEILPGGKAVLFTIGKGGSFDDAQVAVQRLDNGDRKILIEKGTNARYVPTGHLLFARGGTLLAARFDLERLQVTGPPAPVLQGVRTEMTGAAQFAFSRAGSLVYLPGGAQATNENALVWVDREGVERPLAEIRALFYSVRLSPDGKRLALSIGEDNQDVWVYELERGTLSRLTFGTGEEFDPVWTPDGKRITYSAERPETPLGLDLFWKKADGGGEEERLLTGKGAQIAQSWSSDGQLLAFTKWRPEDPNPSWDIWVLPVQGDRRPRPFLQTSFDEAQPAFSPDGRFLAYTSNESGRDEVYVQPYPGPGSKVQISIEGGTEPAWRSDGREIFYRSGERMMAVATRGEPTSSAAAPKVLFEGRYFGDSLSETRQYDVTPDGRRFVMIKEIEQGSATAQLHVVLEWFSELARRVPPAR